MCQCDAPRNATRLPPRHRVQSSRRARLRQDAAVNHEKNESARSQHRRPSHRVSHDRFPPYRTSITVRVCGSCVRCVSAIRLFVEYLRRLPASIAGHDPQHAWAGRLVTPQYPSIAFPPCPHVRRSSFLACRTVEISMSTSLGSWWPVSRSPWARATCSKCAAGQLACLAPGAVQDGRVY